MAPGTRRRGTHRKTVHPRKRYRRYTYERKQVAVDHYLEHGRRLKRTMPCARPSEKPRAAHDMKVGAADVFLETVTRPFLGFDSIVVLHWVHPTKQLLDAFVVVPANVFVEQGEYLAAGALLSMLRVDGLSLHPSEESLHRRVIRRRTALRARRPRQTESFMSPSRPRSPVSGSRGRSAPRDARRPAAWPQPWQIQRWDESWRCTRQSCRHDSRSSAKNTPSHPKP